MGVLAKIAGVKDRLKEPSTQAGIASMAALLSIVGVPATLTEAAIQIVGGIASLAAVFMKERK
jgi:hypothetical protein